jgi:hypothetical protein
LAPAGLESTGAPAGENHRQLTATARLQGALGAASRVASELLESLYMLLPEQVQRLFQLALVEFAPDWEIAGAITELSVNNAEHWVSGLATFGLILRNSQTSGVKVLGWRTGRIQSATYFRGISYRVLEAYADRITDPIRRYFEEIGILMPQDLPAWSAKPPERSHTRYA